MVRSDLNVKPGSAVYHGVSFEYRPQVLTTVEIPSLVYLMVKYTVVLALASPLRENVSSPIEAVMLSVSSLMGIT